MHLFGYRQVSGIKIDPIRLFEEASYSKIAEEEEIIRTICLYMQTNVLYVPPRKPGNELPRCLEEFYRKILDDLKQKFAAEFMESRSIKSSTLENDYLEVQR